MCDDSLQIGNRLSSGRSYKIDKPQLGSTWTIGRAYRDPDWIGYRVFVVEPAFICFSCLTFFPLKRFHLLLQGYAGNVAPSHPKVWSWTGDYSARVISDYQMSAICKTRKLPLESYEQHHVNICKHVPGTEAKVKVTRGSIIGVPDLSWYDPSSRSFGSGNKWGFVLGVASLLSYDGKKDSQLVCRLLLSWISNRCLTGRFRVYKKKGDWQFVICIDFPAKGLIKGSCYRMPSL